MLRILATTGLALCLLAAPAAMADDTAPVAELAQVLHDTYEKAYRDAEDTLTPYESMLLNARLELRALDHLETSLRRLNATKELAILTPARHQRRISLLVELDSLRRSHLDAARSLVLFHDTYRTALEANDVTGAYRQLVDRMAAAESNYQAIFRPLREDS